MSGKFRFCRVSQIVTTIYSGDWPWDKIYRVNKPPKYLKDDVCILIFSSAQKSALDTFKESKDYKILFESKGCVNPQPGHSSSRNTVVVFEVKGN